MLELNLNKVCKNTKLKFLMHTLSLDNTLIDKIFIFLYLLLVLTCLISVLIMWIVVINFKLFEVEFSLYIFIDYLSKFTKKINVHVT